MTPTEAQLDLGGLAKVWVWLWAILVDIVFDVGYETDCLIGLKNIEEKNLMVFF